MAGRNGLTALPVARKPLRVVPETRPVEIDTGDGTLTLTGYVQGPGCPMDVYLQAQEIAIEKQESLPSSEQAAALSPARFVLAHTRASMIERRDLLCAVIPGLEIEHANVLAAEGGLWHALLVDLGWWIDPSAPDEEAEDTADPEATAPADAPTGADASPDSSPATPEPTLSA